MEVADLIIERAKDRAKEGPKGLDLLAPEEV
jgi:hypothetical protein